MTLVLSQIVQDALGCGAPIVALESTIISHGFPFPESLEVARALEGEVRAHGAVPATIAVLDGQPRIGLDGAALERLARGEGVEKCSARDLPLMMASGRSGATTVAATCHLAARAGIGVFATGGIGGVHRGAQLTMDVSADLAQLARSPVTVVSAGAKAILDLDRTLEVLETWGVPVVGFGCDELPAFYTRTSGHRLTQRVDDIGALARLISAHRALGFGGGVLVCNPIPEKDALPEAEVEVWIQSALKEANDRGIAGKEVTPFLLDALDRFSKGRTLAANLSLARHNAAVAAQIAVALGSS